MTIEVKINYFSNDLSQMTIEVDDSHQVITNGKNFMIAGANKVAVMDELDSQVEGDTTLPSDEEIESMSWQEIAEWFGMELKPLHEVLASLRDPSDWEIQKIRTLETKGVLKIVSDNITRVCG